MSLEQDSTYLQNCLNESNNEAYDKINESQEKFDEYLKNKYKTDERISKTVSFIVPVFVAFIGAYGLLLESFVNIFITLAKENSVIKNLIRKLFIAHIEIQEFAIGIIYTFKTVFDDSCNIMILNSFNDLFKKVDNSINRLKDLLSEDFNEIIEEKIKNN